MYYGSNGKRVFRITLAGGKSTKIQTTYNEIPSTLIPLIVEGCKIGVNFLITDLDCEDDVVFLNAPTLGVRRYSTDFKNMTGVERPPDLTEIGIERSESEFHKIATLFNLREASRPAPAIVDDWDAYRDWMQHILG